MFSQANKHKPSLSARLEFLSSHYHIPSLKNMPKLIMVAHHNKTIKHVAFYSLLI